MVELRIIFLGTASAVPTKERGLSSVAILRGSELLLFDAGEGMQRALLGAGLGLNRRTRVFITHLHGDHCVGLLGLLQTMAMQGRDKPLFIYGPRGISAFVRGNQRILRFGLTFDLEIHTVRAGVVLREGEYLVRAAPAVHFIPAYAYLLEESKRPGVFHPDRARALGVPEGKLWSDLQHGRTVTVEGRRIRPEDVLGPSRRGRRIGISGDTRPTPRLRRFFTGADVLIFDSTYGDDHRQEATQNLHSTAREAAELARAAGVKHLILTHFSARYEDVTTLREQATKIHPNVMTAHDFLTVLVPMPE